MRLEIPPKVTRILDTLNARGYEAFAVGGCIRDTILGRKPDDWDITTSAYPEEVKELFRRTVDTGLKHGTVTVLLGDDSFEVTTYRIDGEYADHRHPSRVVYTSRLQEDLGRRDFTINAMAYHGDVGLVDLFGGMEDLRRRCIRCVGEPEERFSEDALRILRAVRFSAQLGFDIEERTRAALERLAPTLVHVSMERIQFETVKLLESPNPHYIRILEETGILRAILPEIGGISEDTLAHIREVPPERRLRLAVLLLPLGEKRAVKLLRRMKFDNDTVSVAGRLVRWYDFDIEETPAGMRRALCDIGDDLMERLLLLQAHRKPVERLRDLMTEVLEKGQCYRLRDLAITGGDLIDMGFSPGRRIGICLGKCLDAVIEDPEKNEKEYLKSFAASFI